MYLTEKSTWIYHYTAEKYQKLFLELQWRDRLARGTYKYQKLFLMYY